MSRKFQFNDFKLNDVWCSHHSCILFMFFKYFPCTLCFLTSQCTNLKHDKNVLSINILYKYHYFFGVVTPHGILQTELTLPYHKKVELSGILINLLTLAHSHEGLYDIIL